MARTLKDDAAATGGGGAHEHHAHGHHDDHPHEHDTHGHHAHEHDGHGHHGHHHAPASFGGIFAFAVALNTLYIVAEVVYGLHADALALLADAGHNLSDVLGLGAAWLAQSLARRPPSERFTYGMGRSTIVSALGNAVLLLLVTGGIAWEAILRLVSPSPVAGWTVSLVAAAGIFVNGLSALLLMRGSTHDLNMRGAFLHMASDAAMALAVVVAGAVIALTGWTVIDPLVSLAVSAVIVAGTWSLLRGALAMSLDAVPSRIQPSAVERSLQALEGVSGVHHLHVWSLSTTQAALTVHLVVKPGYDGADGLILRATELVRRDYAIGHATFQVEQGECDTPPDGASPCRFAFRATPLQAPPRHASGA